MNKLWVTLIQLSCAFISFSAFGAGIDETWTRASGSFWSTEWILNSFGSQPFTKSYALIIGVGNYDKMPKLSAPEGDAIRVRDFLRDEAGFDHIVTLTDDKATRDRIEDLMERVFPNLIGPTDRFVYYFSGHGVTRELAMTKRGYLPLKRAGKEDWTMMIDMPKIQQWTENLGKARHALFLLDACFSGLAAFQLKADVREKTLERLMQPGHHILTAGTEGQESFIYAGESLFTQAFLSAARGEDLSVSDGIITLSEITARINRVLDAKRAQTGAQLKMTPQQYHARDRNNAGEFFFVKKVDVAAQVPRQRLGVAVAKGPEPFFNSERASLKPGETFQNCKDCPEMVVLPTGKFNMGSETGEEREGPAHLVSIESQLAVGRYPVTFSEWDACVDDGGCDNYKPSDLGWGRGNRPAINVSWHDVKSYIKWLSQKTGEQYRLPSEAEREYFTRAGSTTKYWWGDEISARQANFSSTAYAKTDAPNRTMPVDAFEPNPWGIFQAHGNVWEWTEDCASFTYRGAPTDGRAWIGGANCDLRILRGGGWDMDALNMRSSNRGWNKPDIRSPTVGFRVVKILAGH